jgi:hypothetical protein
MARGILFVLNKRDEVEAIEHVARLIGKDEFTAFEAMVGIGQFFAFCAARALGADDKTLRAMLKFQQTSAEHT